MDTESRFISTCFIQGNINTRIFNARRGTNPPLSPSGICKRRFAPVYTYVWFYFNELTPAPSGALYLSFINISQSKSFLELPVRLLNLMRKLIRCQFTSRYMGGGLFARQKKCNHLSAMGIRGELNRLNRKTKCASFFSKIQNVILLFPVFFFKLYSHCWLDEGHCNTFL